MRCFIYLYRILDLMQRNIEYENRYLKFSLVALKMDKTINKKNTEICDEGGQLNFHQ